MAIRRVVLVSSGEKAVVNGFSDVAFKAQVECSAGGSIYLTNFSVVGDSVVGFSVMLDGSLLVAGSGPVSAVFPVRPGTNSILEVWVTCAGKGERTVMASGSISLIELQ